MVLTDLTPEGGKNSQLNCMKIGGSVSYGVSELCSNIYLPAEFSLPSSLAVHVCLVYCLFYFFLPVLLSPGLFPRMLFLVAGCRVWMNDSTGVLLLCILQGFSLKPFKARWQKADTADMWPHHSFPPALHNTLWNIVTNSYLLNPDTVPDRNTKPVLVSESRSPERHRRSKRNSYVGVMCMFTVQNTVRVPWPQNQTSKQTYSRWLAVGLAAVHLYLNKDVNNPEERCWMRRSLTAIRPHSDELASALLISSNQLTTTAPFPSCLNGGHLPVSVGAAFFYMTPKTDVLGFYKSFILNFNKPALPYFLSEMTVNCVYKSAIYIYYFPCKLFTGTYVMSTINPL